jgi:Histidine kinase-, DNA gyrase B-, and HSP90-like ATPase
MTSESVEIRPGVGILALLSSMNYKPWYALSELVDNALASFLSNRERLAADPYGQDQVTVKIRFDKGAGEIEVWDDAAGIAEKDVARAFRPAEPPPDTSGLAQFGIGMKSAACWYSRRFTVTSTGLGEEVRREVTFDVPAIVDGKVERLPIEIAPATAAEHGTTLTMSALHRSIPAGKTLWKVRSYLAGIYRDYLRRGLLLLEVGGQPVTYEEPEILTAPRWDANGDAPALEWRKNMVIELSSGQTVTGWAALRAKGSTKEAGLALLFRGKVVVGAGGPAGDVEGLFRPGEVFGASNSFVSQRLFGELDLSAMQVAHSKDAILWDGEEEAFLEGLKQALDEGSMPLLKMASGYRVTEKGAAVDEELNRAVDSTVSAAGESKGGDEDSPPEDDELQGDDPPAPDEAVSGVFKLRLGSSELDVSFAVVVSSGNSWIRVLDEGGGYTIEVDRNHPFMQSFAHLPGQQVEPVLRLAAALGMAEIEARHAGLPNAGGLRARLNHLMRGPLARTTIDEIERV